MLSEASPQFIGLKAQDVVSQPSEQRAEPRLRQRDDAHGFRP